MVPLGGQQTVVFKGDFIREKQQKFTHLKNIYFWQKKLWYFYSIDVSFCVGVSMTDDDNDVGMSGKPSAQRKRESDK